MIIALAFIAIIFITVFVFLQQPKFGRIPQGKRFERINQSPNYKEGKFQNLNPTPQIAEDANFLQMFREFFLSKNKKPVNAVPSVKTNLLNLSPDEDVLVWFGHSSYFIQIDGKKILVDPVFSGSASPFSFSVKAFNGTDRYSAEDIQEIDYLIITHDHWDHLDYKTVLQLKSKIKKIITGLGTGEHLEYWGFEKEIIFEKDWFEKQAFDDGFTFHVTPARHFSGRGLRHKKSLWTSMALQTPTFKIFIGGDGGYDTHFAEIGNIFGEFDLAILENGQYNNNLKYIHMKPEQVLQAAKDVKAKKLFPVHSAKFALANHPWDEPLKKITELNKTTNLPLITPLIGEKVKLKDRNQKFTKWWEQIK